MLERLQSLWVTYGLGALFTDLRKGSVTVLKLACLIRCAREYGVDLTLCVGPSMLPTFNEKGDLVLLEHYSVYAQRIQPGDVVVAKSAQTPRYVVCKRVLGLEGDVVRVWPATGTALPHRTVDFSNASNTAQKDRVSNSAAEQMVRISAFVSKKHVPKGHVWLQGDNAINSTDSRHYGPVPYALLQGRVFLKIWPPHQAGWVESKFPC